MPLDHLQTSDFGGARLAGSSRRRRPGECPPRSRPGRPGQRRWQLPLGGRPRRCRPPWLRAGPVRRRSRVPSSGGNRQRPGSSGRGRPSQPEGRESECRGSVGSWRAGGGGRPLMTAMRLCFGFNQRSQGPSSRNRPALAKPHGIWRGAQGNRHAAFFADAPTSTPTATHNRRSGPTTRAHLQI